MNIMIIGGGAIADSTHIPAARSILGVDNVVVAEPNEAQRVKLQEKYGLAHIVSDYHDVLSSVDACIICTPPHLHNRILADCLVAHKHVLCEKPLSPSCEETRNVLDAAGDDLVVGMCHTYRFHPSRIEIRALIKNGFFGKSPVVSIHEGLPSNWPTVSGYCFKKELVPGGALYDNGIHSLDFLLWCFGSPDCVDYSDDAIGGLESNLEIRLSFGQALAYYKLSRTRELSNTIVVEGNGHKAVIGIFNPQSYILDGETKLCPPLECGLGEIQLKNFIGAVNGTETISCSALDGLNVIDLLERCYSQRKEIQIEPRPLGGFAGKTVFVTGGTGFIGSHLVEQLVLHEGARVKVLVHNWGKAAYVSRFDVDFIQADILDEKAIETAMADCDYVFHLAILGSVEANVKATENIMFSAKANNVKHVVQMSSVVVHGETVSPDLTADSPLVSYGDSYADGKLKSEHRFWQLLDELDIHGSIVRPTYVWGPYSMWYTLYQMNQMKEGDFTWVDEGRGVCNAVYVGNVVDLCLRCCTTPAADHQAFIAADDDDLDWREFFSYYLAVLGKSPEQYPSIPLVDGFDRKWRKWAKGWLSSWMKVLMDKYEELRPEAPTKALWLYKAPRKVLRLTQKQIVKRLPEMNATSMAIYSQNCKIDISKNQDILGFHSRYSVSEGMRITCDWLNWSDIY